MAATVAIRHMISFTFGGIMLVLKKIVARLSCSVLLLLAGGSVALAFQVQPMVFDLATTGVQSRQSLTVTNTSSQDLPVELTINKFVISETGEPEQEPGGEDDFLIFPPQTIIPPGAAQVFRVQWVGEPVLPESTSYNVVVKQIPVELPQTEVETPQVQLQVVYNIATAVTVAATEGAPDVSVVGAEAAELNGAPAVAVTFRNDGNLHQYVRNGELDLSADGWSRTLVSAELADLIGFGLLQPGRTRRVVIPVEGLPITSGPVEAAIAF